jgi:hypothetical protein
VARRFIVCDGADIARLWARIGAGESEELLWVPREDESRVRPPRFRSLQGGLGVGAIEKLDPKEGDEFALASEEGPFVRAAVAAVSDAAPGAPILVMSDKLQDGDLPEHPCLRRTGLRSLIRDDVDQEFTHLGNLHRVVEIRNLLGGREKLGILLQPDPDPDGIACGYALRALLGRKSPTAPLVSFGEIKRPENLAMVQALGIEVRTITSDDLDEFDGLALVDVQPTVFGENPPSRLTCRRPISTFDPSSEQRCCTGSRAIPSCWVGTPAAPTSKPSPSCIPGTVPLCSGGSSGRHCLTTACAPWVAPSHRRRSKRGSTCSYSGAYART